MDLSRGGRAALTFPFLASVCLAVWGFGAPAEGSYGVRWGGRGPLLVTLDPEGNRTSVTTPKGQTTTFEYDELGKLTKVIQPAVTVQASGGGAPTPQTPVTTYVYDEARNRTRQTDANNHVVAMEYDDLNRLKKTTQDPGNLNLVTETTDFDENGNPRVIVDPKGQTITNTWDELNRLKTTRYAFATGETELPWRHTTLESFTYDENGNLLRQDETVASGTDPPAYAAAIVRTYDRLDRLQSEAIPLPEGGSKTLTHTYWKNGLRRTTTDAESGLTSFVYDGQNRLKTVTTSLGTSTHTYFGDGLLETLTQPDGSVATNAYDKADRLLSVTHAKDAATIASYSYSYDPNGNRLTQVETNGGAPETTSYTYDELDRLETVNYPDKKLAYGYDAAGNRTRETERTLADAVVSDKDAAFDAVNRLQGVTDLAKPDTDLSRTTSFDWDRNGNQLAKTEGSGGAAVTTSFVYDIRNKLAEARQGASILARYQYDAEGRLLKKIGEDGIRQYVYDEASRFVEYDQAGTRVARFSYGSDRLISMEHRTEGARFYHLDGLGSVAALTDTTGAVAARIHADAWGNFRIPSELDASANRFAFTGHVFERELGLYNARARFLDPEFGRFISQDSYLGQIDEPPSLHRYSYAHNNPTFFVDPTGHIARQILDQSINRSTDQASNWFIAGVTAFFKEASYQTLDVISFGALHRQDKLVDQNLAGEISDTEYHSKTAWNVALSSGQAAMTLGTGGTLGATRGAAVAWGAAGGIAGQGVSDIGEIYATETKTLDQVRATDYLLAGAMGAVGGYAGYKARGITQAEKTGVIAEQGQSVRPEAPAPAARAASTGDVNVQPAIKPAGQGGPSSATAHPGRLAAESSDISKESIMRALRRSGTLEGAATAKLLKRGKVTLELTDQLPPGVVGRNPWTKGPNPRASKIAQVSTTGNRTPLEAAGATAHEARHVLQDLTPRTYGRFHEFDPYRWQIKIDRRFGASLRRDYGVADTEAAIRMHIDAQYSTIPYRARDIVMPNPNPRLP